MRPGRRFSRRLSRLAGIPTSETILPMMAFGTGLVSVYSSTSGTVMPVFLPMVPDLAQQIGAVETSTWRVDHRGRRARRFLGALHRGRPVSGRGAARHQHARAVQRAARVGALDVRGRRSALLDSVRVRAPDNQVSEDDPEDRWEQRESENAQHRAGHAGRQRQARIPKLSRGTSAVVATVLFPAPRRLRATPGRTPSGPATSGGLRCRTGTP